MNKITDENFRTICPVCQSVNPFFIHQTNSDIYAKIKCFKCMKSISIDKKNCIISINDIQKEGITP